jgi:hypothetical protein
MGFFSSFKLTDQEKSIIEQHDAPVPDAFVEDVRTKMTEHGISEAFEKEYLSFVKKFGDSMTVGHVVVCSDRACRGAGLPLIREF